MACRVTPKSQCFAWSAFGRFCCKNPKMPCYEFFAKRGNTRQSPIDVSSSAPAKSPVNSSLVDVVAHMIIRLPRLQPGKILFSGAKRLLQHGVIPESSQTWARGISSPGKYGASLMRPCNDGERQWNLMSDLTCR